MNATIDFVREHWLAGASGLLGWGIGFFSDIGKEKWKRNLQAREDYERVLLDQIVSPIFDYLKDFYLPICEMKSCPLGIGRIAITQKMDKIVGDGYVRTDYKLEALVPARTTNAILGQVEYWHESESFQRYYADALENHHATLLKRWESFRKSFESVSAQCLSRAEQIDKALRAKIGMPQAQAGGQQIPTWASYERLAILVYKRQLGIGAEHLYFPDRARNMVSVSGVCEQVIQSASLEESQKAIGFVEELALIKNGLGPLIQSFKRLDAEVKSLIEDFRVVLANKPSRKWCSLVWG